jgi:predicted metal-dependent phosphoesterase TrpH
MGFADLHIHSIYSYDGTCTIPAILKYVAEKTDLKVIAITDHDSIAGIQEAKELGPHYGIDVIPACEVSTADGHLLALFIDRLVQPGRTLTDTVLEIADQDGLCIAAHPTARGTSSLSFETICRSLQHPTVPKCLVGVEAFNGGLVYTRNNPTVAARAALLPLAKVGNSDAHILSIIGQGSTEFSGSTARELQSALETRQTLVRVGKGLSGLEVIKKYIPGYLLRKLGWALWNAQPSAPLQYIRLSRLMMENPNAH